ncbi:unnamed protein product [Paramecium sonneborni]|uniref:Uncharacterized protein n=1 Tax=Paramecium sonneborni TaxID=65129 RepID=A0A8S1KDH1_9CILI|nr:unnamed protein product [Paramecium sonneborni]
MWLSCFKHLNLKWFKVFQIMWVQSLREWSIIIDIDINWSALSRADLSTQFLKIKEKA